MSITLLLLLPTTKHWLQNISITYSKENVEEAVHIFKKDHWGLSLWLRTQQVNCGRNTLLKQIAEKAYRYNIEIEMLFLDFKRAFHKIKRNCINETLEEMKMPLKLRDLMHMTCTNAIMYKHNVENSGDTLSTTQFNPGFGVYIK